MRILEKIDMKQVNKINNTIMLSKNKALLNFMKHQLRKEETFTYIEGLSDSEIRAKLPDDVESLGRFFKEWLGVSSDIEALKVLYRKERRLNLLDIVTAKEENRHLRQAFGEFFKNNLSEEKRELKVVFSIHIADFYDMNEGSFSSCTSKEGKEHFFPSSYAFSRDFLVIKFYDEKGRLQVRQVACLNEAGNWLVFKQYSTAAAQTVKAAEEYIINTLNLQKKEAGGLKYVIKGGAGCCNMEDHSFFSVYLDLDTHKEIYTNCSKYFFNIAKPVCLNCLDNSALATKERAFSLCSSCEDNYTELGIKADNYLRYHSFNSSWVFNGKPYYSFREAVEAVKEEEWDVIEISAACAECGDTVDEDSSYTINDDVYCEYCYNERYTHCYNCDVDILREEAYYLAHGETYCEECLNEHFTECAGCGEYFRLVEEGRDGYLYCEECFSAQFTKCACCNEVLYLDDTREGSDGCRYCEECFNEQEEEEPFFQ